MTLHPIGYSPLSRLLLIPILCAVTSLPAAVAAPRAAKVVAPAPNVSQINVRALGARGDGTTDDTSAFERALAQGAREKLPVYVPRGRYVISCPLVLNEQELIGDGGGWNADSVPMATLMIAQTAGPGVALGAFSTLRGMALMYDENAQFPANNPPAAIELRGQGPTISQVRIQYPYDGITTAPGALPGRARLSDIFMVRPQHGGLYLTGSLDVAQLRNIEVWCNGKMASGAAFKFGRNDDCQLESLFAFNCEIGFDFETNLLPAEKGGGDFFGSLSNCSTDACATGFRVRGDHKFNLTNSNFLNHRADFDIDGAGASIRVSNCYMQSNGAPNAIITNAADFSIAGSTFTRAFAGNFPYVEAQNCQSLMVTNCNFKNFGPGLVLGEGVQRAIVTGNNFESPLPAITDKMKPGSTKILAPNLTTTP